MDDARTSFLQANLTLPADIDARLARPFLCANMTAPTSYNNGAPVQPAAAAIAAKGATVNIGLKMFPARNNNNNGTSSSKGQVWVLNGGPGDSWDGGRLGLFTQDSFWKLSADHDIMLMDDRGVGDSTRLACSPDLESAIFRSLGNDTATSAAIAACADQIRATTGYELKDFTTSLAARDLNLAIEQTRGGQGQDKTITLYGISYGTFHAQRFMRLFPAVADRVVLDGAVAHPATFNQTVSAADEAFTNLMGFCDKHAGCRAAFINNQTSSSSSSATAAAVAAAVAAGSGSTHAAVAQIIRTFDSANTTCAEGFRTAVPPGTVLATYIGENLANPRIPFGNSSVDGRGALLALVARANRCDATKGDLDYMQLFAASQKALGGFAPPDHGQSELLAANVLASEIMRPAIPTDAAFMAAVQSSMTVIRSTFFSIVKLARAWPEYSDTDDHTWDAPIPKNVRAKVLVVAGDLDPQTQLSQAQQVVASLTSQGVSNELLRVPAAAHAQGYMHACATDSIVGFVDGGSGGAAFNAAACEGDVVDLSLLDSVAAGVPESAGAAAAAAGNVNNNTTAAGTPASTQTPKSGAEAVVFTRASALLMAVVIVAVTVL
ncbi:hypothetical protein BDZ88DRAFT_426313 [Geranomyces variabilis]|nr:hypothetical protein BDZ88DRAFT_426313 [Geranomyces variabilis]KAJ3136479.1 hypothetical protein HDU90_003191 [Geranomyces variabilis]